MSRQITFECLFFFFFHYLEKMKHENKLDVEITAHQNSLKLGSSSTVPQLEDLDERLISTKFEVEMASICC